MRIYKLLVLHRLMNGYFVEAVNRNLYNEHIFLHVHRHSCQRNQGGVLARPKQNAGTVLKLNETTFLDVLFRPF